MSDKIKQLREKAMKLPMSPGVYIMLDKNKDIIYIGKAKSLKNRVSQYFGSEKNHSDKVRRMVANVDDFNYILTDSEFEALILECSLIKQNTPKYNILLKDDKGYHYIKVTKGDWPRISAVKQVLDDGAEYIGPYMSSWYVKNSVDEAQKIFLLPDCNRSFSEGKCDKRPCLNYYIKQCCAPCRGKVSKREYKDAVKDAVEFLRGGNKISIKKLENKMKEASENMEFELAAKIRDRINSVKKMSEKQKVVASSVKQQDVIALAKAGNKSCFEVFRFENGNLYDREEFLMDDVGDEESARAEFIQQYYTMRNKIPKQITVDGRVEYNESIERWLSEKLGKSVKIVVPQRGNQARLIEMCRNNALERIAQNMGQTAKETSVLTELGELLGLEKVPSYIEAYDISNLAGSENVAGMVVFKNAKPLKSAYRRFKIKSFDGQDDYGSMREVMSRRLDEYERLKESGEGFGRLPDLILLDGGKGHVAAVEPILRSRGINVPLYGMVKDNKHRTRAIAKNGGEIAINSNRRVFTLISTIQDEVHRFAIGYHRQSRKKNTMVTELTNIQGIGEKRARSLYIRFKTLKRISEAEVEELETTSGMTKDAAISLYNYFHSNE